MDVLAEVCGERMMKVIVQRWVHPAQTADGSICAKVHSIGGENYDDTSGIRGPKFTFSQIRRAHLKR